jgi:DNA processing protein
VGRAFWAGRIGPAGFMRLLARFGSAQAVLRGADGRELVGPGLRLNAGADRGDHHRCAMTRREGIEEEFVALGDAGIEVICGFEDAYPAPLRDARTPPPVVCVRGTLRPEDTQGLAIVGTREPTDEGCRAASDVAVACARHGLTVVSGLARGIDTVRASRARSTQEDARSRCSAQASGISIRAATSASPPV